MCIKLGIGSQPWETPKMSSSDLWEADNVVLATVKITN